MISLVVVTVSVLRLVCVISEVLVDTNHCVVVTGTVMIARDTSVVVIVCGITVVNGTISVDVVVCTTLAVTVWVLVSV